MARSGGTDDSDDPAVNRLGMIYDATFHDTLAELGGNPWLRESLARLRSHLHMYRLYHHARQGAATNAEHVAIAEAIAAADPDAAEAAMRDAPRTPPCNGSTTCSPRDVSRWVHDSRLNGKRPSHEGL